MHSLSKRPPLYIILSALANAEQHVWNGEWWLRTSWEEHELLCIFIPYVYLHCIIGSTNKDSVLNGPVSRVQAGRQADMGAFEGTGLNNNNNNNHDHKNQKLLRFYRNNNMTGFLMLLFIYESERDH